MAIDLKLIDKLLLDYKKPEDIIGENGLLKQLTKAVLERAMQVEMTDHLGYEKHDPAGNNSGNSRNGASRAMNSASVARAVGVSVSRAAISKRPATSQSAVASM